MAIQTDNIYGSADRPLWVFFRYDDKNTINESRWRGVEIGGVNNATVAYLIYVEDPATSPPSRVEVTLLPGTSASWPIPPEFATKSPYDYNWGARAAE